MIKLEIQNPFNAPVFFEKTVSSTMDVSRILTSNGELHGTVIAADFQKAGRGRIRSRSWEMDRKKNLPFTIFLRYPCIEQIPKALTLRVGLAVIAAIEKFSPMTQGVKIKWPNDIIIGFKKAAGILCEADGGNVHVGIGINIAQTKFSGYLKDKATSIALAAFRKILPAERFHLLELILACLYNELVEDNWKERLVQRLYKIGEQVTFIEGPAGSIDEMPGNKINGILSGIGDAGELLIIPNGETNERAFFTGELYCISNE
jgi:BirA family biotin operon repressor/biotin-[acetyl-CoA-carboxylase] ligase